MAVQTSYSDRMPVAHAGQISDSSLHNIDGATAALDVIQVGVPVIYVAGGPSVNHTKTVREIAAGDALAGKMFGISVHSHYANYRGGYQKGDAVNVMRTGRIWARTDSAAARTLGQVVHIVPATADLPAHVAATGGVEVTGWQFTGETGTAPNGDFIAEVELSTPQVAAAAAAGA